MMTGDRPLLATMVDLDGGPDRRVAIWISGRDVTITEVGGEDGVDPPYWLVPGLADAHVHVSGMDGSAAQRFVSAGVLAVRDLGGRVDRVLGWPGGPVPRVVPFGGQLDQYPLPEHMSADLGAVAVRHFGNVTAHIDHLIRSGAAGMKLYVGFPPELVPPAVRAAHEAGLRVAFPLGSGSLPAFRRTAVHVAVDAGTDSIEHVHSLTGDLLPPARLDAYVCDVLDSVAAAFGRVFRAWAEIDPAGVRARRVIDLMVARRTVLVPTIAPFARMARGPAGPAGGIVGAFVRTRPSDPAGLEAGLANMVAFVAELHAAGGLVAVGTDTASSIGMPAGAGVSEEMCLLLDAGVGARDVVLMACGHGERAERLAIPGPAVPRQFVLLRGASLGDAIRRWDVGLVVADRRVQHTAADPAVTGSGGQPGTPRARR
jgi:hypothetical protein